MILHLMASLFDQEPSRKSDMTIEKEIFIVKDNRVNKTNTVYKNKYVQKIMENGIDDLSDILDTV